MEEAEVSHLSEREIKAAIRLLLRRSLDPTSGNNQLSNKLYVGSLLFRTG